MALEKQETIKLSTPMGEREIQLWIGDITCLPVEDQVDMVFTSAFFGDYSPVNGTLIGALWKNLKLSVRQLSKNKEADMRKMFSCWVSELLPPGLPYKRLVCFEFNWFKENGISSVKDSGSLAAQLSEMFRAMMPVFNNHESSVITPLLATGCQGQSQPQILKALVNSACRWIKAGLPLKCLKLVLYSPKPDILRQEDKEAIKLFRKLKASWKASDDDKSVESVSYDVCLSYTAEDTEHAANIVKELKKQRPNIQIHSKMFVFDKEKAWQDEVFDVMKNSQRIIIVLTPAYVANPDCVEEFNMALCCNRLKKQEVVMPFLFDIVPNLPSYMSLVQYMMCKVRKENETAEALLAAACKGLFESLSQWESSESSEDRAVLEANRKKTYDILISYSHRSREEPKKLYNILQENYPHLDVFFDSSELKAGNLWQQALYEAVDKSRCIVAFLSEGYCKSSVCNEEFSISLARHFAQESMMLIPVHTDQVEVLPRDLTSVACVDVGRSDENLKQLADSVVSMLEASRNAKQPPFPALLKDKMGELRAVEFKTKFQMDRGQVVSRNPPGAEAVVQGEIAFVYAQDCLKLAAILCVLLRQLAPDLVCHMITQDASQRRAQLENARMVVVIVSDQLVGSQTLLEEMHVALCRQRTIKDDTIVYLMQNGHSEAQPFYMQALPYRVSLDDDALWRRLERAASNRNPRYLVDVQGLQGTYRCTPAQNLALTTAAHDIVCLIAESGSGTSLPYNIVNIADVENALAGLDNADVPVNEHIISLASINHLAWKSDQPSQGRHKTLSASASIQLPSPPSTPPEKVKSKPQKSGDSEMVSIAGLFEVSGSKEGHAAVNGDAVDKTMAWTPQQDIPNQKKLANGEDEAMSTENNNLAVIALRQKQMEEELEQFVDSSSQPKSKTCSVL